MGRRGRPALLQAVPVRLVRKLLRLPGRSGGNSRRRLVRLIRGLPPELRTRALTHSSRAASRIHSNERLEFLGDSVLGLIVASEVFRRYPESEEGELARLKAFVVSRKSCAEVADRLGVGRLMLDQARGAGSDRGEEASFGRTAVGNALEALIGAVFLRFGFKRTSRAVIDAFEEQLQYGATTHVDYKTALQEMLASRGLQPEYRLVAEEGPAHARVFSSEVRVAGAARGRGTGTTIKMSEQAAAKEAFIVLGSDAGSD